MPLRLLALVLALAPLSACWVPIEQGQAMESDIVKLKAELAAQRKDIDDSDVRAERERVRLKSDQDAALKRIDAKIREVSETLEALNRAARKTGADLGVELEQAQTEVARLRGLVEETQAKYQALEQSVAQIRADTDQKLASTDNRLKQWDDARRQAEGTKADTERKAAERPTTKEAFYTLAKDKLDGGDPAAARQLFSEFLGKWKDDQLASNAQYWIGESYYAEKRYREAIFEFKKVGDQYPRSDKAPDALLKMAFAFAELGLMDDAKLFLEEVGRSYPKAIAAKLAKDKLAELAKKKK